METIKLNKRNILGKGLKKLEAANKVPAVVYNSKGESTAVETELGPVLRALAHASTTTILNVDVDGKLMKVLIKEVQYNPRDGRCQHVAFFQIDESKEMQFEVPIEIVGIAPAVKNNLGALVRPVQSLDVKCKLADLVPSIKVDISNLEATGQSISVSDLQFPEGMRLVREEEKKMIVVTISEITEESAAPTTPAEGEEAAAPAEAEEKAE